MDRDDTQRQRSVAPRELRVDTDNDWMANQPSPRRVSTAPSSPSTAYATDREAVFRSGNATVSETHVIRSSGSQSQSFTEEHWSSEITSFVATAPPKFIQVIKAYRVLNSDTPTLVVEVASEPPAIFEWFCNDKPVLQDKRQFQARHGLNITTLTVYRPEQGVYKCTARNPAGCSTSYGYITVNFEHNYEDWSVQEKVTEETKVSTSRRSSSITYNQAPRFTTQVPNLTVPPGNEAVIDVEVDADPPARFSWFVNGREFRDSSDNVELYYPKENRCVARFSIPVSGQYKVVASNVHGSAMSSGYVEIYQANPTRQMRPPMPPGEHLSRTMMTTSQHTGGVVGETPAVTSKQSMSVYEVNYSQRSSSVPRGVRHLESHVEVAKSPEPVFMSSSARHSRDEPFEMVAPDLPQESAPKITVPLHSTSFMDGQPMILRCQIQATPSAAIVWSKDDVNVEEWVLNKDVTTQIHPDGTCELLNPECFTEDAGLYKCQASNPYGTAETSAYISVEGETYKKDKEEASMSESFASEMHPAAGNIILPPKFVEPLTAETDGIDQLKYFRLVCRVISGSPVTLLWMLDGKPLEASPKYEIFEFEDGTEILTIHDPSHNDNGVYTCTAESDHGLATTSCEVRLPISDEEPKAETKQELDIEIVPTPPKEPTPPSEHFEIVLPAVTHVEKPTTPTVETDEIAGITEIKKNEEEFKLLVKVADSVASVLVANVFVDAVREAARRIVAEESSEEEELDIDGRAPRFDTSVEEYVATEGGSIRISTTVAGYPTPFVVWYLGEKQLKVSQNLSMSYEKNVASLNLKDVRQEDAGTYYCHATNPHGTTVLSTKLKVAPKQPDIHIRTSLAKYDKNEADEKVVTNVFAHVPETAEDQKINVLIKKSDSQTSLTIPKEDVDDFEYVKKSESSTPPDFEVVSADQMQEEAPPTQPSEEVTVTTVLTTIEAAPSGKETSEFTVVPSEQKEEPAATPISAHKKPEEMSDAAKEEKAAIPTFEHESVIAEETKETEITVVTTVGAAAQESEVVAEVSTAAVEEAKKEDLKLEQKREEQPMTTQQPQEVPKIIVPDEQPPVPAPRTKKIQATEEAAAAATAVSEEAQPVEEPNPLVKSVAEKFADSFTKQVLNQAQNVLLTFPATEETAETQVVKTQTTIVLEREDESGRRSVTMPFEEKVKTIEERLEAAASPDLSAEQAVNMMMETVIALKNQHVSDTELTVDVRNPDSRFDHMVTVVEPQVLQFGLRLSSPAVPQLKFIDMETILQKPSTSHEVGCQLSTPSKRSANAEHRVIVLEGASQSFQNAMTWSLRKVQKLADEEQSNMNIDVVRPDEAGSQVTTVVDAQKIIPNLLQVAAAASKLKLENVTVSLVKRGDTAHTQLVIEYESQTDDDTNLNTSQLQYERPVETKEEMWSRRSRFSEEDERVAAVFVEVDATCPDQSVEIVATVNMPLEASVEPTPIDSFESVPAEIQEHSRSLTETSGATGLQPPKFFRQLADCQGIVGHPVQFKCIVSGTPTPQIVWSVDGDVIEPNHEYSIVYEDGVSILRINEIVSEDEGEYWCEAINDAGRASTKCFLKVLKAGDERVSADSHSDPDSTDLFEWEERRIQALLEREKEAMLTSEDDFYPADSASQEVCISCVYNPDLKEVSAFHKYFETSETVVMVTELYEIGTVEASVKAPKKPLRRTSSTSTTEASFTNRKKNSQCIATTRIEKQNSLSKESATVSSTSNLWNSEFENPFGTQDQVNIDESRMFEPRTPLLPMKLSYKGQEIDVAVNEVEKEETVVNKEGQVEVSKKTVLETSLEFNRPVDNPKKISLKKLEPQATGTDIAQQIDELRAETAGLADAIRRAEEELDSLELYKSMETPILNRAGGDTESQSATSFATSEAELIALLRSTDGSSADQIPEVEKQEVVKAIDVQPIPPKIQQIDHEVEENPMLSKTQRPKETSSPQKEPEATNFLDTMKQIERIARNVEQELAEISGNNSATSGNELSDDAKSIEEAILMMSDRLVMQRPLTEAQAEASEELLRTTLADMILNPSRTLEEEIELMKKPIRILRRKISDIENSLMEDPEVREIVEKEDPSTATTSTPATVLSPGEKIKRVPSAELIRMTPLTSNIKEQLDQLEDMINEHLDSETTDAEKKEPTIATVKRKELHHIFTQINEEINTIRMYCSKKLTKKGADAVMSVLHKVKTHVTSIVNVMSLAKKKKSKHDVATITQGFHFKKYLESEEVEKIIVYKRHSLESSFTHQSSTQRSSAAMSTSDDTWRYSKMDASRDGNSRSLKDSYDFNEEPPVQNVAPSEILPTLTKIEQEEEVPPLPPPRRRRTQSADSRPAVETAPLPPPRRRRQHGEVETEEQATIINLEMEGVPQTSDYSMTMRTRSLDRNTFKIRKTHSEQCTKPLPPAPSKPKRSFAEGARDLFKNFKNPLKRKEKSKKSEEYVPLVNEDTTQEQIMETSLLEELRLMSLEPQVVPPTAEEHDAGVEVEMFGKNESPFYDEVARSKSGTSAAGPQTEFNEEAIVQETSVNVVLANSNSEYGEEVADVIHLVKETEPLETPVIEETSKWSEEEISSFYAAACIGHAFHIGNEHRRSQTILPLKNLHSAMYSTQIDDNYSVNMLCEESDYGTDTDTSCLVKGSVKIFRTSPASVRSSFIEQNITKIEEENDDEVVQDVVVNIELQSVDCDDVKSEAQYSFAEMLVYESDLDSEEQSHKQKSEAQTSNTRSDDTMHMVIDEHQLSQMISCDKIEEEQDSKGSTIRETDILSDESVKEVEEETHCAFEFEKYPSRRRIVASISPVMKHAITATITDDLLDVVVEQEPESYGLVIKIIEDQVDFTSLTVFTNQDDDISDSRDILNVDAADFTETSSFDEYEVDDHKTGINVSIIARSLHDSIYASLEEIPWGEVEMTVKQNEMTRSVDNSVQFNVTVSENADERKSLKSQPSFRESQNSISEENTLSNASINIPSYVIKFGSTATITCELNNYLSPNSKLDWVKGKQLVSRKPGKYDRISHDLLEVLIINSVEFDDQDLYSLKVNEDVFPVAFLIVEESAEEPPMILTPPQTQFVMDGHPTEICVQVTRCAKDVVWYKDKKPLSDTSRMATGFADNFSKVIFGETRTADQGTYVATLGDQSVATTLVVEERIDEKEVTVIASGTESEDDDIQEYLVPPGSTATIACELEESDNRRSLTWIRDGRPLVFAHSHKLEHVVNGLKHYLVIHDTGVGDSGVYSVSISGTEFRVAHLVVNDLATSIQSLRRKRISNSSLNK